MIVLEKASQKQRDYELFVNGRRMNIFVKHLKGPLDTFNNLWNNDEFEFRRGFFIYNRKAFSSILMKLKVDLLFMDRENVVIHVEESFENGKFSKYFEECFKIYILPEKTIRYFKFKSGDNIEHFSTWSTIFKSVKSRFEIH